MKNVLARRISAEIGRKLARLLFTPFVRVHMQCPDGGLPRGAFIFASNHISHFDPPIIGGRTARQIDWMAMAELFRNPWMARLMRALGTFPVQRGTADRAAIRTALERLGSGAPVGMFPEAGIRAGETSVLGGAPMRPGVAVLATMANVPVVPCVILGSERLYNRQNLRLFRRIPVWIAIGEPIFLNNDLKGAAVRADLSERIQGAMLRLQATLVEKYHLTPDDMPKTPQARKGEDPYIGKN